MIKTRYLIGFLTLSAIVFLVGGVVKIHLDGKNSLQSDIKTREFQVAINLEFIHFTTVIKTYFLDEYENNEELKIKKKAYDSTIKSFKKNPILEGVDLSKLKSLENDHLTLQRRRLRNLKKIKLQEQQLNKSWADLFNSLENKIGKRIKNKQDFLPGLKERLSRWGETLPILKDLRNSIDVSYVEKGKLDQLQSIVDFTQWLFSKRSEDKLTMALFLPQLEKTLLNEVEKEEIKLSFRQILTQSKELKKAKDLSQGAKKRLESISKRLDDLLQKSLIPAWQSYAAQINNQELQEKAKAQQRTLEQSVALAIAIILILFLYSRKLRKEERENMKLSDSLQRMRRMSERGELAAKMAHEIKNPLSILTYCLGDSLENINNNNYQKAKEELEKSVEALNRLTLISQSSPTQVIHHQLNHQKDEVDLVMVLKDLETQYQSWLEKEGILLQLNLEIKKAILHISRLEILGAFSNLLDNAIEFLRDLPQTSPKITIELNEDAQHFILRFKNGGPEIKKSKDPFNNFYSTKAGFNRGLGLSIVKDTIESAQGSISYSYEEGENIFTLLFPK